MTEQPAVPRGPIGWARHCAALRTPTPPQGRPPRAQDGPQRPDAGAETPDGAGGRQTGADGREALRRQIAEALAGHAGSKAFLADGTEWSTPAPPGTRTPTLPSRPSRSSWRSATPTPGAKTCRRVWKGRGPARFGRRTASSFSVVGFAVASPCPTLASTSPPTGLGSSTPTPHRWGGSNRGAAAGRAAGGGRPRGAGVTWRRPRPGSTPDRGRCAVHLRHERVVLRQADQGHVVDLQRHPVPLHLSRHPGAPQQAGQRDQQARAPTLPVVATQMPATIASTPSH